MASKYMRLQELIKISAATNQDRRDAADVGGFRTVIVQVNVLSAAGAGDIILEHAAMNELNQYEALSSQAIAVTATGPITIIVTGHTRFLRWTIPSITGSVTFSVDLILRD